jgi:ABC-type glycerol-3-phosphate transport system substrate-binding protein
VETDQIWGFFNNKQVTADVLGFLGQNGATFLSEDHTKSTMHEPEFIEVIQFLWNLEFKWRVSPTADDVSAITENVEPGKAYHAPFAYQRTAMMNLLLGQESAWGSPQVEEMPIHAVPMVKGKVDKVPAVGACFYLWSQTKVPDEGWELMKFYVTDDESQLGQYTINNYGLPVKRTVWDDSRLETEKSRPPRELDAYLEPLRSGAFFTFQINAVWLPYIRAFGAHRARAWNQEATVEEAMRDASKEVQALLDEYYADK